MINQTTINMKRLLGLFLVSFSLLAVTFQSFANPVSTYYDYHKVYAQPMAFDSVAPSAVPTFTKSITVYAVNTRLVTVLRVVIPSANSPPRFRCTG